MLVLGLGLVVVAALLVTVVANASRVFLHQRALAAAADGAATAAVQQVDEAALYDATADTRLPIDPALAETAARSYASQAGLGDRFPDLTVHTETAGTEVAVTLGARVSVPFVNLVSDAWADGVAIRATARAQAPLVP